VVGVIALHAADFGTRHLSGEKLLKLLFSDGTSRRRLRRLRGAGWQRRPEQKEVDTAHFTRPFWSHSPVGIDSGPCRRVRNKIPNGAAADVGPGAEVLELSDVTPAEAGSRGLVQIGRAHV